MRGAAFDPALEECAIAICFTLEDAGFAQGAVDTCGCQAGGGGTDVDRHAAALSSNCASFFAWSSLTSASMILPSDMPCTTWSSS